MIQPTSTTPAMSASSRCRSRFSKALPAVPRLSESFTDSTSTPPQLPPISKDLPALPESLDEKSYVPQPATMSITRRPVAANSSMRPSSPTATMSSLTSVYSRSSESHTTSTSNSVVTQSASSRQASPTYLHGASADTKYPAPVSAHGQLPPSQHSSEPLETAISPPSQNMNMLHHSSQKGNEESFNLQLDYSFASKASSSSGISSSSVTTVVPKFAPQDRSDSSSPLVLRKQPSIVGQHSVNNRPSTAQSEASSYRIPPSSVSCARSYPSLRSANIGGPVINRLPTPEYQKGEIREPVRDAFPSTVSPALSPSSPGAPMSRTPVSEPATVSDRSRGSSVSPNRRLRTADQIPRQHRYPPSPFIVHSERGPLYRGRDGTLYPEMGALPEPDPRAFYFPTYTVENAMASDCEGVYNASELRRSHYVCYHKHRYMYRRSNRSYPLTCQTCNVANTEDRWACTFCYLRICGPCFGILDENQRDLKRLMAVLEEAKAANPSGDDTRVNGVSVSDGPVYGGSASDGSA